MLAVLHAAADAIAAALAATPDRGLAGTRPGQHRSDLADRRRRRRRAGRRRVRRAVRGERCAGRMRRCGRRASIRSTARPTPLAASRGTPRRCARSTMTARWSPWSSNLVNGVRYEAVRGGGARRDGEPVTPVRGFRACPCSHRPVRLPAPRARLGPVPRLRRSRARPLRRRRRGARRLRRLQPRRPRLRGTTWVRAGVPGGRCARRRCARPRSRRPSVTRIAAHRWRRPRPSCWRTCSRRGAPSRDRARPPRCCSRSSAGSRRACAGPRSMPSRPATTSERSPWCERDDGALLFVRHSYRRRWGVPGGLVARGEDPRRRACGARCARRSGCASSWSGSRPSSSTRETRRVDVIFAARPVDGEDPTRSRPGRPEIVECRWFAADDLPPLQHETAGALVVLARRGDLRLRIAGTTTQAPREAPATRRSKARPKRSGGHAEPSARQPAAVRGWAPLRSLHSRATLGCRSLPSARASIWRMRSRVRSNESPTWASVRGSVGVEPEAQRQHGRSRSLSRASWARSASRSSAAAATSYGASASGSSTRSPSSASESSESLNDSDRIGAAVAQGQLDVLLR